MRMALRTISAVVTASRRLVLGCDPSLGMQITSGDTKLARMHAWYATTMRNIVDRGAMHAPTQGHKRYHYTGRWKHFRCTYNASCLMQHYTQVEVLHIRLQTGYGYLAFWRAERQ